MKTFSEEKRPLLLLFRVVVVVATSGNEGREEKAARKDSVNASGIEKRSPERIFCAEEESGRART